jgi:TM2 domain-containing membrane protein YozV
MQTSYFLCIWLPILIVCVTTSASLATTTCTSNTDCGSNGICSKSTNICNCTQAGYVTVSSDKPCAYQQKKKLVAFLLSLLAGPTGADWFYLSSGSTGYIVAGVFKLLTFGGLGIWAIVDWIRVLVDAFPDGQGVALESW